MIILGVVGGILLMIFILMISTPIVIRFQTPATCLRIRWLFVTFQYYQKEATFYSELTIFSKRFALPGEKKAKKKTSAPKKQRPQKKTTKTARNKGSFWSALDYAHQSSLIEDGFSVAAGFFGRLYRSVHIRKLIWWIGLGDLYWQGIITGFLYGIPRTKNLQITGNFEEKNSLDMEVRVSIWKIVFAITALLFRMPYVRVFRLYRILK